MSTLTVESVPVLGPEGECVSFNVEGVEALTFEVAGDA